MIQRQLRRRKHTPAELASIVIAKQNVLARKRPGLLGNVTVGQEADHRGNLHGARGGVDFPVMQLLGLSDTLEQKHHGASHGGYIDGLEGRVQDQDGLLHNGRPAINGLWRLRAAFVLMWGRDWFVPSTRDFVCA